MQCKLTVHTRQHTQEGLRASLSAPCSDHGVVLPVKGRDPKVRDLEDTAGQVGRHRGDQNVLPLQVPVNDVVLVEICLKTCDTTNAKAQWSRATPRMQQ